MTAVAANPSRYDFVDNAKALGIVLVVLGHARGISNSLVDLIFSFHIPLFFLLAAFLVKPEKINEGMAACIRRVVKNLLVPYVVFFAISYLYWLATRHIGVKNELFGSLPWFDPLIGLLTGIGTQLYINTPLWFFPCLISTILTYHIARRYIDSRSALLVFNMTALLMMIVSPLVTYRLPWGLDNMWVALAFYASGQFGRERLQAFRFDVRWQLLALFVLGSVWAALALANGRVDLNGMIFGNETLLYLPIAYTGIATALLASSLLPVTQATRWISDNALIIFPLHMLVFSVVRGGLISFNVIAANYQYTIVWALAVTALAIVVAVPAARVMRMLLPGIFMRKAGI